MKHTIKLGATVKFISHPNSPYMVGHVGMVVRVGENYHSTYKKPTPSTFTAAKAKYAVRIVGNNAHGPSPKWARPDMIEAINAS